MATLKEKLDKLCLEYQVRSSFPEKFKEELRMLVVREASEMLSKASTRKSGETFPPGDGLSGFRG